MNKKNCVFIATSLDGYIADKNGGIDWLHSIPNPDSIDMGYGAFTSGMDALVMGRTTYETILGFGIDWPYKIPVFVLSNTLTEVPEQLNGQVELVKGTLEEILDQIHKKGYFRLYIDGGTTIQGFLKEDLIDEMIITIIPVLLGGGISLFGDLPTPLNFECKGSKIFLDMVVQSHFKRKK